MNLPETETSTLTFDDAFEELPEDATASRNDEPTALVVLQSLNPEFATVELMETKTILGRQSRVQQVSKNGMNIRRTHEASDQQQPSASKRPIADVVKSDDDRCLTLADSNDDHASKKTRLDSSESETPVVKSEVASAGDDEQIEGELECGICHEIMVRPLVLQPCLHSFCRACCKMWLASHRDCPSCRKNVERTGRDFKLKNIIAAFLKKRPELAREEEEDDGASSDSSNIIRHRRRRRRNIDDDDGDDEDDEDEDDEEEDDDGDGFNFANANGFPNWIQPRATDCPCCDPNNNTGYVCPDDVRLQPLPQPVTYAAYLQRRTMHPGHTQCQGCQDILPVINDPAKQDIADQFRCKMCHTPHCGCTTKSVEDHIQANRTVHGFLNPFEDTILQNYMAAQGLTDAAVWQQIKTGMDNNTFFYLGAPPPVATGARPGRAQSQARASAPTDIPASASTNNTPQASGDAGSQPTPPSSSLASTSASPTAQDPHGAGSSTATSSSAPSNRSMGDAAVSAGSDSAPPVAAPAVDDQQPPQAPTGLGQIGRAVKSSDKLCHPCQIDFFKHGPIYQWRKNIDPARLPPRVVSRPNCWYGRACRTQYNFQNPGHAQRLNHVCEPSN
ncbi:hypothetical protein BGZ73_003992 [Actinomortierella ambigua]|nr:hypothetical protein BGZ73_003992 [Actinomortierella ambigua]